VVLVRRVAQQSSRNAGRLYAGALERSSTIEDPFEQHEAARAIGDLVPRLEGLDRTKDRPEHMPLHHHVERAGRRLLGGGVQERHIQPASCGLLSSS